MKVLTLLDVHLWDGGDRHDYAYTFNEQTACTNELKSKFKHCHIMTRTVIIYDNLADFEDNKKEIERQRVLAKLTKQERELLGLS